ncbi:MAG: DUF427 domain-containing protein [Pseudomonadota bacterium]
MTDTLATRRVGGVWVVRAGGAVIAETRSAIELEEPGQPPVVYFPRDDVAMAFLDAGSETTAHRGKGDATLFSVATKSTTISDAAWSYEDPVESLAALKDYIGFDTEQVTVERL